VNIDLLANGSRTTDGNGPISISLDNGKRALERQELLLNGRLANVDQIINVVNYNISLNCLSQTLLVG
jgi:hypothetical protein